MDSFGTNLKSVWIDFGGTFRNHSESCQRLVNGLFLRICVVVFIYMYAASPKFLKLSSAYLTPNAIMLSLLAPHETRRGGGDTNFLF